MGQTVQSREEADLRLCICFICAPSVMVKLSCSTGAAALVIEHSMEKALSLRGTPLSPLLFVLSSSCTHITHSRNSLRWVSLASPRAVSHLSQTYFF